MFPRIQWSTLVIILLCILMASVLYARQHVNIRIEPLENQSKMSPSDAVTKVTNMRDAVKGPLNLADNHDKYQDMILDYDQWAGFQQLQLLGDPSNIDKNITMFNSLSDFRTNLNTTLQFLDKQ